MWLWSGKFPKQKLHNNNHPELHPGQFNLHCNASPSRAPTWSRSSFFLYTLISLHTCLPTHSTSHNGKEGWLGKMITSLPTYLSLYTLNYSPLYLCTSRRYLWDWPLIETCGLSSLIAVVRGEEVKAVGWTESTLFPCVVVSFVINIDQSN